MHEREMSENPHNPSSSAVKCYFFRNKNSAWQHYWMEVNAMSDAVVAAVTSGLASAVVAGALTYVTAVLKIRRDLAAQYDADLRRDRIAVYKQLWSKLEPLAKYAPAKALTCDDAHGLAAALRSWYFEEGGLFLSEPARNAYFGLQEALKTVSEHSKQRLPDPMLALLMERGSELRTQLTRDVGTRAQPMLSEKMPPGLGGLVKDDGTKAMRSAVGS